MNGQPPSPPPPPPAAPVPPIQPAPVYYPPPRSGMGCFAKGCLIVFILGFLCLGVVGVGGWYFYKKTFNNLTSTEPAEVRAEPPTPAQTKAAENPRRADEAIAKNRDATIEFTGRN
jgi:hypothetical protein